MVALVVAPDLELSKVERRGILTVPSEDATASCRCPAGQPCEGLRLGMLPLASRTLEKYALEMADRFISRLAVRGYDLIGQEVRLHGPWVSYEFNQRLADVESSVWNEAMRRNEDGDDDPAKALGFVFERAFSPYSDYLLVGEFLKRNVLTEVIV